MLKDILTPKKALFLPDAHTELRGQLSRSRGATIVSGNLTGNARQDISGISARVYKNGTYGFASMAEYSADAAKEVLRAANENAERRADAPRNETFRRLRRGRVLENVAAKPPRT